MKTKRLRLPNKSTIDSKISQLEKEVKYLDLKSKIETIKIKSSSSLSPSGGNVYESANTSRRHFDSKNFPYDIGSADELILPEREIIAERASKIYKNNAIGKAIVDKPLMSIIGSGLKPQSNIDQKFLGWDDDKTDEFQDIIEKKFNCWAESLNSDFNKRLRFYQLQSLAQKTELIKGESFAILPRKNRGESTNLTIQLIDPNLVGSSQNVNGNKYRDGILLNDEGEISSYLIARKQFYNLSLTDFKEIPAFTKDGRQNILHIFTPDYIGQSRGVPISASVLSNISFTDKANKHEIINQVVSTLFTGFITSNRTDAMRDPALQAGVEETADNLDYTMEAGAIHRLNEGENITFANPQRAISEFINFMEWQATSIGMATGIPVEMLLGKISSNFSAHKANRIEFWRYILYKRANFNRQFNTPIYREFVTDLVLNGEIDAPGFVEDKDYREAYLGVSWKGEGQGQIEPVRETNAAQMRIDANLSTYEEETSILGGDFETNIRRKAREVKKLKELQLIDSQQMKLFNDSQNGNQIDDEGNRIDDSSEDNNDNSDKNENDSENTSDNSTSEYNNNDNEG